MISKVFFKNGKVLEGDIISSSKKELYIILTNGDKVRIFKPYEQLVMIVETAQNTIEKQSSIKETVENNNTTENIIENNDKPIEKIVPLMVGQVWNFEDGSKWEITDLIHLYATLENIITKKQICPERIEIQHNKNGWTFDGEYAVVKNQNKQEKYEPDFDLKTKNLAELRKIKIKEEKKELASKLKNIEVGGSSLTTYQLPSFKATK